MNTGHRSDVRVTLIPLILSGPYTPQPARKSHKRCLSSAESSSVPRARTNSIPTAVYSRSKPSDNTKFMKASIFRKASDHIRS